MNGHLSSSRRARPQVFGAPATRRVVGALALAIVLGSVAACSDDSTSRSTSTSDTGSGSASRTTTTATATATAASPSLVAPAEFERRVASEGVVTINVHVPNEGSIDGTDLTISFDRIAESTELPADRSTPLAVYCRSGNMSAAAVRDLADLGYTDIIELDGGFNAWRSSGREVLAA